MEKERRDKEEKIWDETMDIFVRMLDIICLHLQMEPTQLSWIERASLCLQNK
jgi:hypothetical protein